MPVLASKPRRAVALLVIALTAGAVTTAHADIQSQINSSRAHDQALQGSIGADSQKIHGFQGRVDDLRARLFAVQSTLSTEAAELNSLQTRLRSSRARLTRLRIAAKRDQRILSDQLVAQYEAPHPDLIDVILQAHGFAALLELADSMHTISTHNSAITHLVKTRRAQVAVQAARLSGLEARQARVTKAKQIQRDQVAELKDAIVAKQLVYIRARQSKSAQLASLRSERTKLERRLTASIASFSAPFPGHGGAYGFFQAPGTNYSVGDEPEIARRLDRMGKELHLHLIGISGYRTPQHSVEVGGFANDPHTQGKASDTPGLEGVPEGTLNHYGLTRPFAGAAEADHVQLVGSI
jgi:peptidoglycan hydrolase CwlO-like protein